jgi:hypothetical protein
MRKKYFRDRLGIVSKKDKRDPYRRVRRMMLQANLYACRNYSPRPNKVNAHMFLSKDQRFDRKRDGRGMWLKVFETAGNTYDSIPGSGLLFLEEQNARKTFVAIMHKELDAIHG